MEINFPFNYDTLTHRDRIKIFLSQGRLIPKPKYQLGQTVWFKNSVEESKIIARWVYYNYEIEYDTVTAVPLADFTRRNRADESILHVSPTV